MSDEMPLPAPGPLSRRAVLAAGGVATASAALVVTGCSTYSPQSAAPAETGAAEAPAPAPAPQTGGAAPPAGSGGAGGAASGTAVGPASSIPVGGGKVFGAQKVVVTQPAAGEFKAFSSVCTHQGCAVNSVANGSISCPCHGSEFSATDGAVQAGPAKRPLAAKQVTNDGGTLRVS